MNTTRPYKYRITIKQKEGNQLIIWEEKTIHSDIPLGLCDLAHHQAHLFAQDITEDDDAPKLITTTLFGPGNTYQLVFNHDDYDNLVFIVESTLIGY